MACLAAILVLVAATFLPGLELRASIPIGFFASVPWSGEPIREALGGLAPAVALCFLANVLVGALVFRLMGPAERFLRRWGWFDRAVWPRVVRARGKLRPYVEKHGEWGVALFIGVPLPGTGAYTGAVGAYLLKLDRRRFMAANFAGVLLAAAAVTAICYLVDVGVVSEGSWLQRLFTRRVA